MKLKFAAAALLATAGGVALVVVVKLRRQSTAEVTYILERADPDDYTRWDEVPWSEAAANSIPWSQWKSDHYAATNEKGAPASIYRIVKVTTTEDRVLRKVIREYPASTGL